MRSYSARISIANRSLVKELFFSLLLLTAISSLPSSAQTSDTLANAGEVLYNTYCVACHQQNATGKVGFAPNIRNKDFLALASDDFLKKTIQQGRPGTSMVPWAFLTEEQIDGLIAYLRSRSDALPIDPISLDPQKTYPGNAKEGKTLFDTYCTTCHGEAGNGYASGGPGPAIGGAGFLSVASDDFIYKTLENGRVGTAMKSFIGPKGVANLSTEEAGSIIAYLRNLNGEEPVVATTSKVAGDPEAGEIAFNINCMACHQAGGIGKPGFAPSIRNQDFLAIASDEFIKETITKGRPKTAMIGRPDLSDAVLNDLIAYLRALPSETYKPIGVDSNITFHGNVELGKGKFETYCSACHGQDGEGYIAGVPGPGIGLEGFLSIASDDYILQTVKRGRTGTAMKSLVGTQGVANLSEEDIHDIIAYLRNKNN